MKNRAVYILIALAIVLSFQNCGEAFHSAGSLSNSLSSEGDPTNGSGMGNNGGNGSGGNNNQTIPYVPPASNSELFKCGGGVSPAREKPTLFRLSDEEYKNSLRLILGDKPFRQASMQAAVSGLSSDSIGGMFDTFTDNISEEHADAYFKIAEAAAAILVATTTSPHMRECAATFTRERCLNYFTNSLGTQAFRRPITAAEIKVYVDLVTSLNLADRNQELSFITQAILQSPRFLFYQRTYKAGSEMNLAYYLATRVAFMLTATPPDRELLTKAADGTITQAGVLEAQIDRLMVTAAAKTRIQSFVSSWLHLSEVQNFTGYSKNFFTGAGDREGTYKDSMDEIRLLVNQVVWTQKGSYSDLLMTRASFPQTAGLANLYGTTVWQTGMAPSQLNPSERAGILTRVAVLASGVDETNPYKRGGKLLKQVLCNVMPRPEAAEVDPALLVEPPFDPNRTTRERFHNQTNQAACLGCHSVINPFGFSLSKYDGLGRYSLEESIFDPDGNYVNKLPVNSTASVRIGGQLQDVTDGVDLSQKIANSGDAQACFVRQWYRFSEGSLEQAGQDGCKLEKLYSSSTGTMGNPGSIQQMIKDTLMWEVGNGL